MGALPLFEKVKSTGKMKASIEANSNRICEDFYWGVGSGKDKAKRRSGYAHFKGTDKNGRLVYFSSRADSYDHALFLLDEFLTSVK